jgi:hypothetical protein
MKKMLFASISIMACMLSASFGQNVGVATNAPTERLDVNGNLNVRGSLKVKGNSGIPGQVLQVNNDGTQSWANTFGYKNRKIFINPTTWTVPAGVREIMIEVVGGGGGGAKGGGGGSGGYGIAVCKVAPGENITVSMGGGTGFGSATEMESGSSGVDVTVRNNDLRINMLVAGGMGAKNNSSGTFGGGVLISGDSIIYADYRDGVPGEPTQESFQQRTATEYLTIRKYGDGAPSPYAPHLVQKGTFFIYYTATLFNYTLTFGGGNGPFGCGGAGGNTEFGEWGYRGGSAMAAIFW